MKFLLLTIFFSGSAFAQMAEKCKAFEKTIMSIEKKNRYNYSSVYKVLSLSQSTPQCAEQFAENISDIVVKSLAGDFVRTMKVANKTPKALNFVVGYVNSTTDDKDLAKITENAQKICSLDKKEACKRVDEAARSALKGN